MTGRPPAVSFEASPPEIVADTHGFDELVEGVPQPETEDPIPVRRSTAAPSTFSLAELEVARAPP